RHQGAHATRADAPRAGGAPYRDCCDTKGPAQHVTYAAAVTLLGEWTGAPTALNAFIIGLTAVVIAVLMQQWGCSRLLGLGAGLLYGLLAVGVRYDMNAQPESFANLFALLGLVGITMAARKTDPARFAAWGVGAGFVLAVTGFYKYALIMPYGAAALALIAFIRPAERRLTTRDRVLLFGWVFGGSVTLAATFGLYLVAAGALDEALLHIRFIFLYFPRAQLNPDEFALRSQPLLQTMQYFFRLPVLYGAALAGCLLAIREKDWRGWALLIPLVAGTAAVWLQQRFTPYHWTVILPFAAMACSLLAVRLAAWQAVPQSVSVGVLAAALLVNTAVFFYQDQWLIVGPYVTGQQSQEDFFESQGVWDHKVVADHIRERADPGDGLWVWGHHTAIYHLTGLQTPTRYIYNEPLLMRIRGGHPWRDEWREEALNDVLADPPTYLLITTFDRTYFDFQNPNESWAGIAEYAELTDMHYVREWGFGRFEVYRLLPYWDRRNDPEKLDAVTHADFVALFDQARILSQTDPPAELKDFTLIGDEPHPTVLMHAGGAIAYQVELPEDRACLRADLSMFPDSWAWGGDGSSYRVVVNGDTVFETLVTNDPTDQRWRPVIIDLSSYAGQTVQLELHNGPGPAGDFTGDWAGWGMPRIVQPPGSQPCDSNAILYERPYSAGTTR
ncbi:MAG: hypothetical protein ACFB51_04380, partial [Anaerolineae bacterium]